MNMSPFRRVDNGTASFYKWSKETSEARTAADTFQKVHDPESREWNDKPRVPCKDWIVALIFSASFSRH